MRPLRFNDCIINNTYSIWYCHIKSYEIFPRHIFVYVIICFPSVFVALLSLFGSIVNKQFFLIYLRCPETWYILMAAFLCMSYWMRRQQGLIRSHISHKRNHHIIRCLSFWWKIYRTNSLRLSDTYVCQVGLFGAKPLLKLPNHYWNINYFSLWHI